MTHTVTELGTQQPPLYLTPALLHTHQHTPHCTHSLRYGIDPASKLAIGGKIATELLTKLLDDLRASKEESLATLTDAERTSHPGGSAAANGTSGSGNGVAGRGAQPPTLSRKSMPLLRPPSRQDRDAGDGTAGAAAAGNGGIATAAGAGKEGAAKAAATVSFAPDEAAASEAPAPNGCNSGGSSGAPAVSRAVSAGAVLAAASAAAAAASSSGGGGALDGDVGSDELASGGEAEIEGFGVDDEGFDAEPDFMHRLCPTYASDINSPLRWEGGRGEVVVFTIPYLHRRRTHMTCVRVGLACEGGRGGAAAVGG